jgi:hypothetical protein
VTSPKKSQGRGTRITKLNNSIDDITAHLAKCHLSKERISEKNSLILVRAGLYCLGEKNIEGMTVCPRHRHAFGISFSGLRQRASIPNTQKKQKHT